MRIAFISAILIALSLQSEAFQKRSNRDYLVTIGTSYGEMKVILYDDTPLHKENFLKLIEEGFYDSLLFHRVIKDFMIQGGDPNSKGAAAGSRLGNGGPGFKVPAEISGAYYHKKGALSAARTGDNFNPERESSGSQFYIVQGKQLPEEEYDRANIRNVGEAFTDFAKENPNHEMVKKVNEILKEKGEEGIKDYVIENISMFEELTGEILAFPEERRAAYTEVGGAQHLDGKYTIFGEVISGLEVIDKIAAVDTNNSDRPKENVVMFITAERMKKKKITKEYGYVYQE